jgi:hypothetical protein
LLSCPWNAGEAEMQDFGLDRQGALVLAIGWLAALWITLT